MYMFHLFRCSCGNCSFKETVEECRCYKEICEIFYKTKELNVDCIINHPGFLTVCLDEYVLEAAYYTYRQQHGNRKEILSEYVNNYTSRQNILTVIMVPISEKLKTYNTYIS